MGSVGCSGSSTLTLPCTIPSPQRAGGCLSGGLQPLLPPASGSAAPAKPQHSLCCQGGGLSARRASAAPGWGISPTPLPSLSTTGSPGKPRSTDWVRHGEWGRLPPPPRQPGPPADEKAPCCHSRFNQGSARWETFQAASGAPAASDGSPGELLAASDVFLISGMGLKDLCK